MMREKTRKPLLRMSLVDRAIAAIAPGYAFERMKNRAMIEAYAGGYTGGKRDRKATKNWVHEGGSANADVVPELPILRARSRDLVRNVPLATGALATNVTHVIGDGLKLRAQCDRQALGISETQAETFNRAAEREFAMACATMDFTRVQDFGELQALVFRSMLESGDVFVIRRFRQHPGDAFGLKLQVIEADRVCNPGRGADTETRVDGVEFAEAGWPQAIHVADAHPGDFNRRALNWRRVPMRYNDGRPIVLHLFERLRPDQARGVPYLAPVVEAIKALGDFTEAEVRAAVVSAMFTVFVKSDGGEDSSPLPTTGTGGANDDAEIALGSGAVVDLGPGEDIQIASGARPNPQFDAFVTSVIRHIGVALELPFELLIKHFTASYSASRAALEMAYHTFRRRRAWMARKFCQPVYEWVLEEAIASGRISAPGFFDDAAMRQAWARATWTGPVRMTLDPMKDAQADEIDRRNGWKTSQQIMTERTGGDFDQKAEELAREDAIRPPMAAAVTADNPPADSADQQDKQT